MKNIFLLFLFLLISIAVLAQQTKKDKQFEKAVALYQSNKPDEALNALDDFLKTNPNDAKAYLLQGEIYSDAKKCKAKAIAAYKKLLSIDSVSFPHVYLITGSWLMDIENYDEAISYLTKLIQFESIDKATLDKAKKNIEISRFRNQLMKNPVSFHPKSMGNQINSDAFEFMNAISYDENLLYFTRRQKGGIETFYSSKRNATSNLWEKAEELPAPLNSENSQGALVFSPDFRLAFITRCNARDSYGSCDLYVSERTATTFSDPLNLGEPVNSSSWDSQPAFSADGQNLFFASKRAGGKGGSDIWKASLQKDGTWNSPQNLGDSVNSPQDEMCPFIHPDGSTLYFSSRSFSGMGGADLFVTKMKPDGSFTKAKNFGYPINTKSDEINLIVASQNYMAYYSKQESETEAGTDIYCFELPKETRPEPLLIFIGHTFDSVTKQPVGANFEFIDVKTNQRIIQSASDPVTGKFELYLPPNHQCAVNISKTGYLFYSETLSFNNHELGKTVHKDFYLNPIKIGERVVLKNIFFETDKYELQRESFAELEKLMDFLNKNPKLKIEISGHTDNQGNDTYNLTLSTNRALAVYNFLMGKGISKERLTYKGYGKTQPIGTNQSEEGRKNNRRTEFKVTQK